MKNELIEINADELGIKFEPSKIEFNAYVAIKERLQDELNRFDNLAVTEENVKDSKKIRASLNTLEKMINDKRREIKKSNEKPYKVIESQFKELTSLIDDVKLPIDQSIKELADIEKQKRQEKVMDIIYEMCQTRGITPDEVPFNSKWLNKSMSMHQVQLDLDSVMKMIVDHHKAVDNNIEVVKQLAGSKGLDAEPFIIQAKEDVPLDQLMNNINESAEIKEEEKQRKQSELEAQLAELKSVGNKKVDKSTGEIVYKGYAIKVSVTDNQLKLIEKFLEDNNIDNVIVED